MKRASVRYADPETGDKWLVIHDVRSRYGIWKKCSSDISEGEKTRSGGISRYSFRYGHRGLVWCDSAGNESEAAYRSLRKALMAFIEEMKRRKPSAENEAAQKRGKK